MTTGVAIGRASIGRHSKSFSLAQKLLPRACRDSAAVVYAWCRRADDAVDERPPAEARRAVERLELELEEVYHGVPQRDPLLESFRQVVCEHEIPRQYPADLLAGMRMDVDGTRYETLPELYLYCYRVAGTVGLMMCHVMGVRDPRALRHAAHLGIAMQLTNICRDVVEDWGRQRLYIPRSLLRALPRSPDSSGEAAFPRQHQAVFASAVARLLERADCFYASGDRGLHYLELRSRWAVCVARLVYARIGNVLRQRGCDVTLGRAYVSRAAKWWLVLCSLGRLLGALPRALFRQATPQDCPPALRYPRDILPL